MKSFFSEKIKKIHKLKVDHQNNYNLHDKLHKQTDKSFSIYSKDQYKSNHGLKTFPILKMNIKEDAPKNPENLLSYYSKEAFVSKKLIENNNFPSYQNKTKIHETNSKFYFKKLSTTIENLQKTPDKQRFLLKNDYIAVPNRVFLSKRIGEIDQNLLNSMIQLSKSLVVRKNKAKSTTQLFEFKPKQNFELNIIAEKILDVESNNENENEEEKPKIFQPKKILNRDLERKEKAKNLLNRNMSHHLEEEIQKILKPKNKSDKKVVFKA